MKKYQDLGNMKLVPSTEYDKKEAYYFLYHVVLKVSSSTTKLRVALMCHSSSGFYFNDLLMISPRVQKDLLTSCTSLLQFSSCSACRDTKMSLFRCSEGFVVPSEIS